MAEYVEMYRSLDGDNQLQKELEALKQRLDIAQKKKSKLLEFNVTGQITDAEYLSMNKECAAEIKQTQAQIQELEQQMYSTEEFRKHMDAIRTTLEAARRDAQTGMITVEFVSRYIDKIVVTPEENDTLRLDIRIFTGESTKKYLQNLKVRAGQMSRGTDANEEKHRGLRKIPWTVVRVTRSRTWVTAPTSLPSWMMGLPDTRMSSRGQKNFVFLVRLLCVFTGKR